MPAFRIREATRADIGEIQVVRNAVRENRLSDPSVVTDQDCEHYLERRGKGWVSEDGGKIMGFGIADLEGSSIWALFILPEYEGMGLGSRLQQIMLEWYFGRTDKTIWLSTSPGTRAEEFYRRTGWEEKGRTQGGEVRFEMTRVKFLRLDS